MSPDGSESGRQNLSLSAQLWHWNQQGKLGVTFGFYPPQRRYPFSRCRLD